MSRPIHVLGLGAQGIDSLAASARLALDAATFVAGGKRQLELIGPRDVETFAIGDNIDALIDRLKTRRSDERCIVLASGDPLFFGIGTTLLRAFSAQELIVEPGVSSMQLAFARAGLAWQDAVIASVHGRPLEETLRPLLGRPLIGLFTQDGESPAKIAAFFQESGLSRYSAWVCENLGRAQESVEQMPIPELIRRRFARLNFVILKRDAESIVETEVALDREFATPEFGPILLTHADVRAITLNRFYEVPPGPIWDIGAGLGGVSVDLARRFPAREVIAIEKSADQLKFLRENRLRFSAFSLKIVEGSAPEILSDLASPAGVFLGGSGGKLEAILDVVFKRLRVRGLFVANFVGLENLSATLDRLKSAGWPVEVTQVQICQGEPLGGLTTFVPLRPVWVVRAVRPESGGQS